MPAEGGDLPDERDGCRIVRLGTVTVTFHPDLEVLRQQMRGLPADAVKLVVDNSCDAQVEQGLFALRDAVPGLQLLFNSSNLGLAAALDLGVRALAQAAPPCTDVLLLDQDSEPLDEAIAELVQAFDRLQRQGMRPGAVGPRLLDHDTGLAHGFHRMTRWRWTRVFPSVQQPPVRVANLNGSGTLMPIGIYLQLGGLDRELFIDHVDTEWSFRLLQAGYTLWGVPAATFRHRMGERGLRWWLFGWRVWPARSAFRHRYLFRNTLWLMRRPYVPRTWKFWAALKLLITLFVHALFDPLRGRQLRCMAQGISEGWSGGRGPR